MKKLPAKAALAKIVVDAAVKQEPTTIEAALTIIDTMRSQIEDFVDQIEEMQREVDSANERADDAESAATEMKTESDEMFERMTLDEDAISGLACIQQKLKAGRTTEAASDLDHLLQRVDCGGAIRGATVAILL